MRRALHSRRVGLVAVILVGIAGSANATLVTAPGYMVEDFNPAGYTNGALNGWYAAADNLGTVPSGNVHATTDPSQGPTGNNVNGDGNYLQVKDIGTTGAWVSAGPDWGTPTSPKNFMQFNGLQMFFEAAYLGNSNQFGQGLAAAFGTVTINNSLDNLHFSHDFGTLTTFGVFQQFGALFTATTFGAPDEATWDRAISRVTNITIETSAHTTNSNDLIGIDEFGFNPEPSTYLLMGGGLIGIIVARLRFTRKKR